MCEGYRIWPTFYNFWIVFLNWFNNVVFFILIYFNIFAAPSKQSKRSCICCVRSIKQSKRSCICCVSSIKQSKRSCICCVMSIKQSKRSCICCVRSIKQSKRSCICCVMSIKQSKRSCICCVRSINFAYISAIFQLDFEPVLTVWYLLFFFLFLLYFIQKKHTWSLYITQGVGIGYQYSYVVFKFSTLH